MTPANGSKWLFVRDAEQPNEQIKFCAAAAAEGVGQEFAFMPRRARQTTERRIQFFTCEKIEFRWPSVVRLRRLEAAIESLPRFDHVALARPCCRQKRGPKNCIERLSKTMAAQRRDNGGSAPADRGRSAATSPGRKGKTRRTQKTATDSKRNSIVSGERSSQWPPHSLLSTLSSDFIIVGRDDAHLGAVVRCPKFANVKSLQSGKAAKAAADKQWEMEKWSRGAKKAATEWTGIRTD